MFHQGLHPNCITVQERWVEILSKHKVGVLEIHNHFPQNLGGQDISIDLGEWKVPAK